MFQGFVKNGADDNGRTKGKNKEGGGEMDSLISRQAAIKCTEMLYRDARDDASYMLIGYNHALSDMRAVLKSLPSAQPDYDLSDYSDKLWRKAYERGKAEAEPRWIPVTERLPEKHEEVLVTVAGEIVIAWLYIDGRWRSNDCPEAYLNDHITAWMPLPEPYRKETEDGQG